MNKLKLIIGREYWSRVKKKTFILTTILTPLGFIAFMVVVVLLMTAGAEEKRIAIIDDAALLGLDTAALASSNDVVFEYNKNLKLEDLKNTYSEKGFEGILHIPHTEGQNIEKLVDTRSFQLNYYSNRQLGANTQNYIQSAIAKRIESVKLQRMGIEQRMLDLAHTTQKDVQFIPITLGEVKGAEEEVSSNRIYVATFLGGIMMFLIYFVIVIYGNMVMRSVMEEKTNRIVEIIISSVKPFELMLGKIIGVGAVGLTQFAIWAITFPLIYLGIGIAFAGRFQKLQASGPSADISDSEIEEILSAINELWTFDYTQIVIFFLLFFLAGYVLYASLFAAIGAAMGDDWGEGQSLTLVVVIPVVMAFYVGIAVIENPNSSLAFWASLFPLFSPVVMPARIVFEPPIWQIILSLVLLIGTCLLFVWISGRIYRAGILMYGKKTTLKELLKWMFIKE